MNAPEAATRRPPVYLDNHATTRTDPRVVEALLPYLTESYGNASGSGHAFGRAAADAVERARGQVADLIDAPAREITFTSGATESNNLALKGILPSLKQKGDHIVTTAIEHKAVLDPLRRLAREGWRLTVVPADPDGLVRPEAVTAALTDRTVLVSVMAANNEVGTLQDVTAIARVCRDRGVIVHTDATQAVGRVPFSAPESGADLASFSSHKLYGPKGIGALWVRRGAGGPRLSPLFDGGGQERGLRSGTVAVPLAVGFGAAAEIAHKEGPEERERIRGLRDRLHAGLWDRGTEPKLNGHDALRLPGCLNVSFAGVDGFALLAGLGRAGLAVSSGAACSSENPEPSHVLLALGLSESLARASLRFGLGRFTTADEVDFAAEAVARVLVGLRGHKSAGEVNRGN